MSLPPPPPDAAETLDQNMTPADLIAALERLPFRRAGDMGRPSDAKRCLIAIDEGVRDYLISALSRRGK
jgi:hypothetical protein